MPRPALPVPRTGTDRRFRAGREPRWCVSAGRLRASRGGPGWRAARQWQRRPPPTPTRPPTSAPSGRLPLPPPRVRPYATPHPRRFWFRPEILQHDPGLAVAIALERPIAPPQVDDVDRHAPDATATGRRSGARPLRRYPTLSVHERELVRVDLVHDLAA